MAPGRIPGAGANPERIDNSADAALSAFRAHYGDPPIDRDAIFGYSVARCTRRIVASDSPPGPAKARPRIPFASDFHTSARDLATLPPGYETGPEYPSSSPVSAPPAPRIDDRITCITCPPKPTATP